MSTGTNTPQPLMAYLAERYAQSPQRQLDQEALGFDPTAAIVQFLGFADHELVNNPPVGESIYQGTKAFLFQGGPSEQRLVPLCSGSGEDMDRRGEESFVSQPAGGNLVNSRAYPVTRPQPQPQQPMRRSRG